MTARLTAAFAETAGFESARGAQLPGARVAELASNTLLGGSVGGTGIGVSVAGILSGMVTATPAAGVLVAAGFIRVRHAR